MKTATDKYILDAQGQIVPCHDILVWARWFEAASKDRTRGVAYDDLGEKGRVSTVFLGLDHSFTRDRDGEQPILFETMVFGGQLDDEQERYATRAQAEAGHAAMLVRVKALP